jgi:hypothetical protein
LTWTGFGFGTTHATAALDIERRGDQYVIVVTDLFATPEKYQRELRARGMDITLEVSPVAEADVGEIIPIPISDVPRGNGNEPVLIPNRITALQRHGTCSPNCPIGVSIPVDFHEKANIILGRAALPGERYAFIYSVDAPGEPLHCVPFIRKTIGQVRELLLKHGATQITLVDGSSGRRDFPDTWFVQEGFVYSANAVTLLVSPTKKRPDLPGPVLSGTPC